MAQPSPLKAQALRGVRWTLYGTLVNLGLQLLLLYLVARWLPRPQLGLAALALTLTQLAVLIADGGLGNVVYRRAQLSPGEPRALLLLGIGLATALAALLYGITPLLAQAYALPELTPLLHIMTLGVLLVGPGLGLRTLLQRHLRFKTLAAVEGLSALVATGVSLSLLLAGWGISALAWGSVARAAVSAAGWFVTGRDLLPSAPADWSHLGLYLRLGALQLVTSLLAFIGGQADVMLTGALLSLVALASFDTAKSLALRPSQLTAPIVQRVFAPTMAQVGADQARLANVYRRMLALTFATNAPVLIGLALASGPLVAVLLGPRWADTAVLLPVAALSALAWLMMSVVGQLLYAKGQAERLLVWNALRAAGSLTAVFVGAYAGPLGIMLGIATLNTALFLTMAATDARRVTGLSLHAQLSPLAPYTLAAAVAAAPTALVLLFVTNPYVALALAAAVYASTYAAWLWRTHPEARELVALVRSQGLLS